MLPASIFTAMALGIEKHAAMKLDAPAPSAQAPRPRVQGLVVPRWANPRILPHSTGRNKGTVPVNPFSGNKGNAIEPPKPPSITEPTAKTAGLAAYVAKKEGGLVTPKRAPPCQPG